jgi:hypothetical protein
MTVIHWEQDIACSAAKAWEVFSNFEEFLVWNKLDVGMEITGSDLGMVRTLVIEGFGRVGERLDLQDHETLRQHYSLVEGTPLGMQTYSAKVQIKAQDEQRCRIYWEGTFTVASDTDENKVGKSLTGSYQGMSSSLATYVTAS